MYDDQIFMNVSSETAREIVRALEASENLSGGAVSFLSDLKQTLARAEEKRQHAPRT